MLIVLVEGRDGEYRDRMYRFWGGNRKIKYMKTILSRAYKFSRDYREVHYVESYSGGAREK